MNPQFLTDVLDGLSKAHKTLPSKYFYDKKGDELFVQIMALPEYYLTRAEMDIFKNKTAELIAALGMDKAQRYELIELGAGDGTKTIELLDALVQENYAFDYLPVDISQNALDGLTDMLQTQLPALQVLPQQGDYFQILHAFAASEQPKIVLFLGSNIGNMSDEQAGQFMRQLSACLKPGDKILLGVDLKKSRDIVLPAYNDAQGITRAFNLNLLDRINRELGADFDIAQFEHCPFYEETEGIAKSYLKSRVKQTVTFPSISTSFDFEAGETIHTEISRKYDDGILLQILEGTGMTIVTRITDEKVWFADYVLGK